MQMVAALYEEIASYQLYAYQETSSAPSTTLWKKVSILLAVAQLTTEMMELTTHKLPHGI
jgi:hypothetical protein